MMKVVVGGLVSERLLVDERLEVAECRKREQEEGEEGRMRRILTGEESRAAERNHWRAR
jgi:hypothetical protein